MKKSLLFVTSLALITLVSMPSIAQQTRLCLPSVRPHIPSEQMPVRGNSPKDAPSAVYHSFHSTPLSPMVVIPGADMLPITSIWEQQSNGRALHNIQVDPSDPNKIHAVITGTTDYVFPTDKSWPNRRCFYTYSSNGGKTWKEPVELQPTWQTPHQRQGYADMVLMQRNGEYVPVIACHRYYPIGSSNVWTALYIEKGHAGEGNFTQILANRSTAEKVANRDIIWPSIAMSADGKSVYCIASVSPASGEDPFPLQFGTFTLNDTRDSATFGGWTAEPGDYSGTPNDGLTSGGAYRIYVSASGHIGVAWSCDYGLTAGGQLSSPSSSIFYSESADGGTTWSSDPIEVQMIDDNADANGYQWIPSSEFDFWFDGDIAKFVSERYLDNFSNNTYFPNSADLVFTDLGAQTAKSIAHADTTTVLADGSDYPGAIPNVLHLPPGSNIKPQGQMISQLSVTRTPVSGRVAVVYQSFYDGDSAFVTNDDISFDTTAYGSIFFSETMDGGATWKDPQLFLRKPGVDLRYPQTSHMNPMTGGTATYHLLVSADSLAGVANVDSMTAEFSINYYAHATVNTTGSAPGNVPGIKVTSGATLDFGNQSLGSSTVKNIIVQDTAGVNVTSVAVTITGSEFSAGTFETTITPGHTLSIPVTFAPTGSTGPRTGSAKITFNGNDQGITVDLAGNVTAAGVATNSATVSNLTISPNPFLSTAAISVTGATNGELRIVVRDALGRDVQSFEPKMLGAGHTQTYMIDAQAMQLTPGVYFVTAISGGSELTRQAVLVK